MANEMITQLPQASNANLSDIIYGVQGYVSPTILGTAVQETLQQVFNLFNSNLVTNYAGDPNGNVAGTAYNFCWDTTNHILYVCTASGTTTTAVWLKSITLTAGSGITISQSGNTIQISSSGSGVGWTEVTGTTQTMASNNGYIASNAGVVTLALPATSSLGDVMYIVGKGSGGWSISQAAGQTINTGSSASTVGVGGSVSSTNQYDSTSLVCIVANTTWTTLNGPQGNLTIV